MSSRVQKGGSIFKPSVKARPRAVGSSSSSATLPKNPDNATQALAPASRAPTQQPTNDSQALSSTTTKPSEFSTPTHGQPIHRNAGPPSFSTASVSGPKPVAAPRKTPSLMTASSRPPPPVRPVASTSLSNPPVRPVASTSLSKTLQEASSSLPTGQALAHEFQNPDVRNEPRSETRYLSSGSPAQELSESSPPSTPGSTLVALQTHQLPSDPALLSDKSESIGANTPHTPPEDAEKDDPGQGTTKKPRKSKKKRVEGENKKKKPPRKRKASPPTAVNDASASEDGDRQPTPKRQRTSSQTPRPRKKGEPPLPPYDPDADPGDEIDPTVVTMAFLCDDTGFGRVSSKAAEIQSNHAAWKALNRQKRAGMRAKMERKKYGLKESDDEDQHVVTETTDKEEAPAPIQDPSSSSAPHGTSSDAGGATIVDESGNDFDYSQNLTTSRYNVQVRIGPNGETIIDEDSLMVDRDENHATENYTHVTESDTTKFTNSGTYGKRFRGSRWSGEETELFFDALAQYGENYELISYVLPGRDRKACKNKFKSEDKKNPARINFALNNTKPVDMNTLSRMTGKDFSGPVPEIAVPPPVIMPTLTQNEETDKTSRPTTPGLVSKRKSRKAALADGVEIMGSVDDYVDTDKEDFKD